MRYFLFLCFLIPGMAPSLPAQTDSLRRPPPPPPPPPAPREEQVFRVVEHMPRFPGCEDIFDKEKRDSCAEARFHQFVYRHLQYPEAAVREGITGTVVVSFIIEKDGSVTDEKITRDIGGGCGEEALRVIRLMRKSGIKWVPGPARGRPVKVLFHYPVRFTEERLEAARGG